jgi:hypothetical protein
VYARLACRRDGRWRLVVDYDTDGPAVTAETYDAVAGTEEERPG